VIIHPAMRVTVSAPAVRPTSRAFFETWDGRAPLEFSSY